MYDELDSVLREYRYGVFHLLEDPPAVIIDMRRRAACIRGLAHFDFSRKDGTCLELTLALGKRLAAETEWHVYRAEGQEPQFFSDPWAWHSFLLIAPRPLTFSEQHSPTASTGALIVDPSFGVCRPLDGTYTLTANRTTPINSPARVSREYHLHTGNNRAVLGIDTDTLVTLGLNGSQFEVCTYRGTRQQKAPAHKARSLVRDPALRDVVEVIVDAAVPGTFGERAYETI